MKIENRLFDSTDDFKSHKHLRLTTAFAVGLFFVSIIFLKLKQFFLTLN